MSELDEHRLFAQHEDIERRMSELEHKLEEHDCGLGKGPDPDDCSVPLAHGSLSISYEAARLILEMLAPTSAPWREDGAFVLYLIGIKVAWRQDDGSVAHRISGGDDGVNIVWKSWKEGVAEGKDFVDHGGWDLMFPAEDSPFANSEDAGVVPSPRPEDGKEPPLPPDYHVLLNLMCKELSIPGSMTFWEAVAWVKKRLPEHQTEVVAKLNAKVERALAILNEDR